MTLANLLGLLLESVKPDAVSIRRLMDAYGVRRNSSRSIITCSN